MATVDGLAAPPTSVEVGNEAILACVPMIAEPEPLGTSTDTTVGTAPESWPTSPPKGDSEMNVGVEPSFSEGNRTLTFGEMVATEPGVPIAVVVCSPAAEIAVILFPMVMVDDSDPYPGGTPEAGPLGYGNLVT